MFIALMLMKSCSYVNTEFAFTWLGTNMLEYNICVSLVVDEV